MGGTGYIHLTALSPAFRDAEQWADAVQHPSLKDVTRSFKLIVGNIRSTMMMPPTLVSLTMMVEKARTEASMLVLGKPAPTTEQDWARFPEIREIYRQRLEGLRTARTFPSYEGSIGFLETAGEAEFTAAGIQGLYSSILISAWTAFESLVADVWERALNVCPVPLADRVIQGQPHGESTDGKGGKSISLDKLREARYDLKGQMGTLLLRRWKRVDFNSLKGIRSAYDTAFDKATDAVFEDWPAHKIVHVLEAVRNLFAHRGGVADPTFIRRVQSYDPFKVVNPGDAVKLTGPLTANLAGSGISCAAGVLKFVDEWLVQHAPDSERSSDQTES